MKSILYITLSALLFCSAPLAEAAVEQSISIENSQARRINDNLRLTADIVLDALKLGSNKQLYITPVIEDASGNSVALPSVLVNGHAMHIAYERKSLSGNARRDHDVCKEVKRTNGKPQTLDYIASTPMQPWMWHLTSSVRWVVDSCGCGVQFASDAGKPENLGLNPADKMRTAYMTPEAKPLPIVIHEGKAQVQFEVSKSDLHTEPYTCKNGQLIDNRPELKVIDDSISHALSDKNMEIAKIKICGYASPEGSYIGNQNLSTNRSRALAQYIAERYKLPAEKSEFDAVPENWAGLREFVEKSPILSVSQRRDLLELIDSPVYGPSDYDAKDQELRTNPKFAELYRTVILPEWYPQLRTTKFEISTRLKPLSDEELAEVIRHTPDKMSLNQMFRVSKLYPEGSDDFNRVIETALHYYPDDETANLNAAAAALKAGKIERAAVLLEKAGDSPEALNARGILSCWNGEMERARELFNAAAPLPEAAKNLEMLGNEND